MTSRGWSGPSWPRGTSTRLSLPAAGQGRRRLLGAVRAVSRRHRRGRSRIPLDPQRVLVGPIEAMGQSLFALLNVKAWPGGPSWLNTSTMLDRHDFAEALAMGTLWHTGSPDPPAGGTPPCLGRAAGKPQRSRSRRTPGSRRRPGPSTRPDSWRRRRSADPRPLSPPSSIFTCPASPPWGGRSRVLPGRGAARGARPGRRAREAVHAILTMAEYQLA